MEKRTMTKKQEAGNVLFLILIAVALFAALSYAVTQSSRGGGNADSETSLIGASTVTQYPASLSTTVLRMSISGTSSDSVDFTIPADVANLNTAALQGNNIFHTDGGGASYQTAPENVVTAAGSSTWVFNGQNQIADIGTTDATETPDTTNVDIVAFLVGVTLGVCEAINDQLGITGIPQDTGIDYATQKDTDGTNTALGLCDATCGAAATIGSATGAHDLNGQPFGCFEDSGAAGTYVYYHALAER